jgi:hypothetical protein
MPVFGPEIRVGIEEEEKEFVWSISLFCYCN